MPTWNNYIECYLSDLNVTIEDILDEAKLKKAYQSTIQPLLTLAANQGFKRDWVYNQ